MPGGEGEPHHGLSGKEDLDPCSKKRGCTVRNVCGGCGLARCATCRRVRCWEACGQYEENRCDIIERAPYVCGDCHRFANCGFVRASYSAVEAQLSYEKRLVETREGISITPAQLESLVELVRTRLRQGWSMEAIWAVHGDRLPVSARTMYKYVEAGLLGLANIDLPRKVRYKPRKVVSGGRPVDRDGRSFSDFLDLPQKTKARAVQMDTVIGKRADFRCILTLHFPAIEFQIMVLLDDHDCEAVVGALDWIETILGTAEFARLFGVILTDRGIEFCDFEALAAFDVASVCTHVNNYPRKSLGGKTPFSQAARLLPKGLLDELGITRLRADEVTLKPSLLSNGQG